MSLSEFWYSSTFRRGLTPQRPTGGVHGSIHAGATGARAPAALLLLGRLWLSPAATLAQTVRSDELGPIRLGTTGSSDEIESRNEGATPSRAPQQRSTDDMRRDDRRRADIVLSDQPSTRDLNLKALSEFERYVQRAVGTPETGAPRIRRFGAELMQGDDGLLSQEAASQIPQDYLISVGDEILVTLWGAVEADLRVVVDRSGRISLPRVGPVMVAGLRYAELSSAIDQRVGLVFKNYRLSASLGRLRSIRVYVTGFTEKPGAYTVSSLSTLANALMRGGGPSASGSFRNIELRRNGKLVSNFDFYNLLLKGDKTADRSLQNEDVVHIGAVGPQVSLIGSVNRPAIFELRANETIDDLLAMAGGFTAIADRSRLTVEHLDARNDSRISELSLPSNARQQPRGGDLLRAFSAVDVTLPQHKQNKRVRIEGEVAAPGEFVLPANSSLADAI